MPELQLFLTRISWFCIGTAFGAVSLAVYLNETSFCFQFFRRFGF